MITILLEQIIQLLTGWIESFNNHAEAVENSLDDLNATAADIETNTDPIPEIRDNTGAVITPINNIKTNTDTIATNTTTTASNTTVIKNNINTIATNTGSASAFAEDCANNTLDIKDKVTTIASDTTQIRATDTNIYGAVNDIKDLMQYYFLTNIVTEEVEGSLCNFDTDLEDYLQKAVVTIPADAGGYSSIDVNKVGKNLLDNTKYYEASANIVVIGQTVAYTSTLFYLRAGNYSIRVNSSKTATVRYRLPDSTNVLIGNTSTDLHFTVNTPTMCAFYLYSANGISMSDVESFQLEIGNDCTQYEPYKIMTDTVSLGSTVTDGAELDLLSGLLKINTTPATYSQLTPIAIRTYKGVNNIYSDIGSMDVIYRETLKHYLDKNNQ